MNTDEIVLLDDSNNFKPIETVEDPILPTQKVNINDDVISLPSWDLTPPFDSIDRGDDL